MTRTLKAVGLAAVCLAWAGTAAAGTPKEKWDAAIAKLAVPIFSFQTTGKLSKAFCVCNSPAVLAGQAGQLETFDSGGGTVTVEVVCNIYIFNPDGSLFGSTGCSDWTPMAK
jgi:hypothetical protein